MIRVASVRIDLIEIQFPFEKLCTIFGDRIGPATHVYHQSISREFSAFSSYVTRGVLNSECFQFCMDGFWRMISIFMKKFKNSFIRLGEPFCVNSHYAKSRSEQHYPSGEWHNRDSKYRIDPDMCSLPRSPQVLCCKRLLVIAGTRAYHVLAALGSTTHRLEQGVGNDAPTDVAPGRGGSADQTSETSMKYHGSAENPSARPAASPHETTSHGGGGVA
jgi:hypothetical protein